MAEQRTYAVYFHPNAIDVLGAAFKPFLIEGTEGAHVLCKEIDTAGSFCEMTVVRTNDKGQPVDCEVMVPAAMVRLVVATSGAEVDFGFG